MTWAAIAALFLIKRMTKSRDLANLGGGFTQGGPNSVKRRVESKLQDTVSLLDFIPEGEHVTIRNGTSSFDCTSALQNAINSGLGAIYIPTGRYKISSPVDLVNDTVIFGDGYSSFLDGTSIPAGGPNTTGSNPIFRIPTPTVDYSLNLQASISAGDRVVTVSSTIDVNPGDLIAFVNGLPYDFNNSNIEGDPGPQVEYLYVISKTATTITLSSRLSFDYSQSQAFAFKPNYLNQVTIRSLRCETNGAYCPVVYGIGAVSLHVSDIFFNGNNKSYFIIGERLIECSFKNCEVENTGQSGALSVTYHSTRNIISNNIFRNHDLSESGDSAIILYYGVNNTTISSNVVIGTGSFDIYGITIHTKSWGNTVVGNTVSGMWAGIGTLFGCFRNTISGNAVSSCDRGIFLLNCRHFTLSGNSVFSCSTSGAPTEGGIVLRGCYDTVVDSNVIDNCPQAGILMYGTEIVRSVISNNSISNCNSGITSTTNVFTINISGNSLYEVNNGIALFSNGSDLTIVNNTITNATSFGIYSYIPGVGYDISRNRLRNIGGNGISFGTGSNVSAGTLNENNISDCGGYGISLTPINIASLKDNLISNVTSGLVENAITSVPTSSLTAPTGYTVYNYPADWTVPRTILGWRRKDSTTGGASGWIQISISET